MKELKTCPFCGAYADFYHTAPQMIGHNDYDDEIGVRCTVCPVKSIFSDYANNRVKERNELAFIHWNTRSG